MKKALIIFLLLTGMMLSYQNASCQQDTLQVKQRRQISKELNISEEKADRLRVAMRTNQAKIDSVLKNKTMKPAVRQKLLRALLNEREEKVKKILTPDEQKKLNAAIESHIGVRRKADQNAMKQTKSQEVAQRQKNQSIKKDTVKHSPK